MAARAMTKETILEGQRTLRRALADLIQSYDAAPPHDPRRLDLKRMVVRLEAEIAYRDRRAAAQDRRRSA